MSEEAGDDSEHSGIQTKSVEELIRAVNQASDGSYAFLIGAGVSRPDPAEIPTAGELISDFKERLHAEIDPEADLEEWAENYESEQRSAGQNEYGFWFSEAYPVPGTRREKIKNLVEGVEPPFGQIILASMMDDGIISHTFTTNFDDLLFDAFYEYSEQRPLFIDHDAKAPQLNMSGDHPAIVKLHGDYLHYTQNTTQETAELKENIRDRFEQSLSEYGLIVVGYGGTDRSIMDVLNRETFSEHGLFWCKREGSTLSERAKSLLNESENAYLVTIEGSESLFGKFWKDIDRVELPQPGEIIARAEKRRDRVKARKDEHVEAETTKGAATDDESQSLDVKSQFWDARDLRTEGRYDEAIRILDEVLEQKEDDARAYLERGLVKENIGELEQALEDYNQVIEIDPKNSAAYINRGNMKRKLGDVEGSIEDYNRAAEITPNEIKVYLNRGISRMDLQKYDAAIEDFNQAVKHDAECVSCLMNRAEAEIFTGKLEAARSDIEKVRSISSDISWRALCLFLELVIGVLQDEDSHEKLDRYRSLCDTEFNINWDFTHMEMWLQDQDIEADKQEEIRKYVQILDQHVDR